MTLSRNSVVVLVPFILIALVHCKSRNVKETSSLQSISDGNPPAGNDTDIPAGEVSSIVNAMKEARFRGMQSVGLDPTKPADVIKYQADRIEPCLANDVSRWSDLVIHYYCQHGAARQCFSTQARATAGSAGGNPEQHYRDTYTFCKGTAGTDSEWKWLTSDNQRAAIFQYIMFTNGRTIFTGTTGKPEAFSQKSQDKIINEYYGVTDSQNTVECHKRPRRNAAQEPDPADQHCGKKTAVASPTTPPANPVVTPPQTAPVAVAVPLNPPQLPGKVKPVTTTASAPIATPMTPAAPVQTASPSVPVAVKPSQIQLGDYKLAGSVCTVSIPVTGSNDTNDVGSFALDFGNACGAVSRQRQEVDGCVSGLCPFRVSSQWRTVELILIDNRTFTIATDPPSQWDFQGKSNINAPSAQSCENYKTQATCDSAKGCGWAYTKPAPRCLDITITDCSYYPEREWCSATPRCIWNQDNNNKCDVRRY